jgi:hypothetical protein
MMKTLTAASLALGLGFASAAFAMPQSTPQNDSFVAQIGVGSTAVVLQDGGNNNQGTFQVGGFNFALTDQYGAGHARHDNTAGTVQVGFGNAAVTVQDGNSNNGENKAFTGQFGVANAAVTAQYGNTANNSTTLQAGAFNHAFVIQH